MLQDQGRTVWHTGTTTGVKLVMQNDGHLAAAALLAGGLSMRVRDT